MRESQGIAGKRFATFSRFLLASCRRWAAVLRTRRRAVSPVPPFGRQSVIRILYAAASRLERKSRPKPRIFRFSTLRETSLRQEIFVFAERNFFLSAKKFHFCRTKSAAVPEKCIIRAFLRRFFRRFLTLPFRKLPSRICGGKGKVGVSFRFDGGNRIRADILSMGAPLPVPLRPACVKMPPEIVSFFVFPYFCGRKQFFLI